MLARFAAWGTLLLVFFSGTAAAAGGCTMVRSSDIEVTMRGLAPLVSVKINGTDEQLILDSGAAYSTLSTQAAQRLSLPRYSDTNFYMEGMTGGRMGTQVARAGSFTIANLQVQNVDFVVVPIIWGDGVTGVLGQNVLRFADVEYDLADGVARLIRPMNCGDSPLAYWATSQPVSVVDLEHASALHPHMIGPVLVDGTSIRALFDTGGQHSIISLHAARLVGVTPHSPGVTAAGTVSGLGGKPIQVWSAPFSSIEIGGEKILHTRALIGDMNDYSADMILGADFFLAHRVYADNSRNRLYFTYNGGPVFNLNTPATGSRAAASSASSAPPPSSGAPSDQPTDGGGFMRRGMAYASRGEIQPALADLTRAVQLEPRNPRFLYQRGLLYWHSRQPQLALADFSASLELDPKSLDAHLARARLQLPSIHAGVQVDLDAVDRLAPPEADLRRSLGDLYDAIGQYAAAIHQYDLWIDNHQDYDTLHEALTARCGLQAAGNMQLERALRDCDKALQLAPYSDHYGVLSNRSLVYLRLGRFDRAMADDTAAIALHPKSPYPLYLRGLAELRKGLKERGQTDLAAAQKLQPDIAKHYASMGLTP